jgi:hypothetical protein
MDNTIEARYIGERAQYLNENFPVWFPARTLCAETVKNPEAQHLFGGTILLLHERGDANLTNTERMDIPLGGSVELLCPRDQADAAEARVRALVRIWDLHNAMIAEAERIASTRNRAFPGAKTEA